MRQVWCRVLPLLLFCSFALAQSALPVSAEIVQPRGVESGYAIVTAETAEVREGPSPKYDVITVVEKGEIFTKLGRTGGWYYLQISDDTVGWVSGRAIRRYQPQTPPTSDVAPDEGSYYSNNPDNYNPYLYSPYYGYPYYYSWDQPYFYGEWYFYGHDSHRYGSRHYDYDHRRYRSNDWHSSRDRSLGDDGRSGGRTRYDGRYGSDAWRGNDSHRDYNNGGGWNGGGWNSQSHSSGPRFPTPFRRR